MKLNKGLVALFLIDILIVWFSIGSSYSFRFYGDFPAEYRLQMIQYAGISTIGFGISFYYFQLYRRAWEHASVEELISILKAVVIGGVLSTAVTLLVLPERVPISIVVRSLETVLLLVGGYRFITRIIGIRTNRNAVDPVLNNVLIVGAGNCGTLIAREIRSSALGMKIVGFIDDDLKKYKMHVLGIPVLGTREHIPSVVKEKDIKEIIIAMPSASRQQISEIVAICKNTGVKLKMMPRLNDLISGKVSLSKVRDISVEDLLGRDPIKTDLDGIMNYVHHKSVLVTGAGGSIGSELCRQISRFEPKELLLLGHGENSIYTIEMELRKTFPDLQLKTIIADIQDKERMNSVFDECRPQVVFHAAAHKHVPLMERNPTEAVKNNVFGTKNVADCADEYGVERFVLISSDKAVNPTSVMGATKRIAEMYIQTLNTSSNTKFVAVRFGNVLGSRGSVIPFFKQQIAEGGPVTVTHPEMVRFFMTIPEAVQLVLQAGSFASGGEIFVLDMGSPVKILNLAEDLIKLSGFEPYEEIDITFTGIREGEKLYEELLTDEENITATQHNRIFIGKPSEMNRSHLELEILRLQRVVADGSTSIKEIIDQIVPMYEVVS
ncbi:nucleoside-diphosphate sugar epimerase/dehydratase [Paenibacillus polygoni]|uniref:Nucleoside-diphosphate sugar epimerase/dehydratase n=1 Tax=Paenibacillus polygoni TaxID=3050112 RepID=A0ABY8X716_9BACL|nr:nucleoside-diphosphate sugar epimerase/dehydratase [Paenibacillus polygoni]WIV20003.1 nucleoside-diphosphate sugar epimerase/dehydratase [Paenibacillus polygoni]